MLQFGSPGCAVSAGSAALAGALAARVARSVSLRTKTKQKMFCAKYRGFHLYSKVLSVFVYNALTIRYGSELLGSFKSIFLF